MGPAAFPSIASHSYRIALVCFPPPPRGRVRVGGQKRWRRRRHFSPPTPALPRKGGGRKTTELRNAVSPLVALDLLDRALGGFFQLRLRALLPGGHVLTQHRHGLRDLHVLSRGHL